MLILFFFRQDAEPIGVGTGAPDTDLRHLGISSAMRHLTF